MNGVIVNVLAKPDDPVAKGQCVVVLEAMKMQHEIVAERDGVIDKILVKPGDQVATRQASGRAQAGPGSRAAARRGRVMSDKAVITCALTGVLTDPAQHPVPVTPAEMAREAKAAFEAGAAIMHVHFRQQAPGKGHLPSWDPNVAAAVMQAIREACPGVILNETTGTLGPDISGPLACLRAVKPEIAACNAGSLNYLKVRADGSWAWPPHLFDNPVEKGESLSRGHARDRNRSRNSNASMSASCAASACMPRTACSPACRDTILSWALSLGMPADPDLLPILGKLDCYRRALAGHRDRPRGDLAAASPRRRAWRPFAHRPRRYVLSADGTKSARTRRWSRLGAVRARGRPFDREPRGSARCSWVSPPRLEPLPRSYRHQRPPGTCSD